MKTIEEKGCFFSKGHEEMFRLCRLCKRPQYGTNAGLCWAGSPNGLALYVTCNLTTRYDRVLGKEKKGKA